MSDWFVYGFVACYGNGRRNAKLVGQGEKTASDVERVRHFLSAFTPRGGALPLEQSLFDVPGDDLTDLVWVSIPWQREFEGEYMEWIWDGEWQNYVEQGWSPRGKATGGRGIIEAIMNG